MHYNLHYEITEEVSKLVTESMLRIYDEYKNDINVLPKDNTIITKVDLINRDK